MPWLAFGVLTSRGAGTLVLAASALRFVTFERSSRARTTTQDLMFPVRLLIGRLWADPPIASEGVLQHSTRSIRGTF